MLVVMADCNQGLQVLLFMLRFGQGCFGTAEQKGSPLHFQTIQFLTYCKELNSHGGYPEAKRIERSKMVKVVEEFEEKGGYNA